MLISTERIREIVMEKDLLAVAEGILDAKEFIKDNLKTQKSVQAYAENGLGFTLTREEAQAVMYVCLAWLWGTEHDELNGTDDYYHTVEKPLENYPDSLGVGSKIILIIGPDGEPNLYDKHSMYDLFGWSAGSVNYSTDAVDDAFLQADDGLDFEEMSNLIAEYEEMRNEKSN